VYGDESMFPVVTPNEEPPATLGDALGSVVAGFGQVGAFAPRDGIKAPNYVQEVLPYALTNPIWLDIDNNGRFDAPGNVAGPAPAIAQNCPKAVMHGSKQPLDLGRHWLAQPQGPRHYQHNDIRKIFHGHGGHGH
jgi:hypothetical protein